jgi:hypothetical protein
MIGYIINFSNLLEAFSCNEILLALLSLALKLKLLADSIISDRGTQIRGAVEALPIKKT